MLRIIILTMGLFFLLGCGEQPVRTQVVTKVEIVEKKVPVICHIPPELDCDFASPIEEEIVKKLLVCVIEQKRIIDECKSLQSQFHIEEEIKETLDDTSNSSK